MPQCTECGDVVSFLPPSDVSEMRTSYPGQWPWIARCKCRKVRKLWVSEAESVFDAWDRCARPQQTVHIPVAPHYGPNGKPSCEGCYFRTVIVGQVLCELRAMQHVGPFDCRSLEKPGPNCPIHSKEARDQMEPL